MSTSDLKRRLVTMRQAADLFSMSVGTLLKWILAGIFRPSVYSRGPVGPGKGSKLSFSDLVYVGTLRSILDSGLRYEHLQSDRRATNPTQVRLQRLPPEEGFEIVESLEGRAIQQYLERLNYEVIVVMDFERSWITGSVTSIWFAPEVSGDWFWKGTGDRYSIPSEKTTFIYCRFWAEYVLERLRNLS